MHSDNRRFSATVTTIAGRAAALALLWASVATAQTRAVAGTYTTSIDSPQGPIKTVIVVKRTGATLGGTMAADGFPTLPLTTVTPSDTALLISADSPDGAVTVKLKFGDGDKVSGSLNYQGTDMPIAGTFAADGAGAAVLTSAVGTYDFVTDGPLLGAAKFDVKCVLTRNAAGVYAGTCGNPENGEVPVGSVVLAGNQVTIAGDTPAGPYRIELTVSGAVLGGAMRIGEESSKVKGTYTAPAGGTR
jgi:hypothetical protein